MTSTDVRSQPVSPVFRLALGSTAAVLVALVVNTGVALAARSVDPHATRTGLTLVAFGPLTVLGVLAGTAGWAAVRRLAARPRAALRVLVPAVVALSFVPDLVVLLTGASPVNAAGLVTMHLVVALVTVGTAIRTLPLPADTIRE
jgi:hypothetical protein